MAIVPHNTIEEIRARCDIADIISEHGIKLQRAGTSMKGLCPFHREKTPSFHVNRARQSYHCFGCQAGGDVFRFVMEYEKVDFMTAVRLLARRAGVTVELSEEDRRDRADKDRLYEVISAAADFYRLALTKSREAQEAREYLKRRNLDGPEVAPFGLGYAPDRSDHLVTWAKEKKITTDLLEKVGILVPSDRGGDPYDRFHGRLLFPIRDEIGREIGFSGRTLPSSTSPAKYVNSPETPLFHKSRILFALDRAKKAIVDQRRALIVEGQIDTIRCHLAGLTHAVAAQGTAITEDHARTLKRLTDEVVLVLDGDAAGQKAAIRSVEVLLAAGLTVRMAPLPPGDDPDSLILKQGAAAIEKVVASAGSPVAFQFRALAGEGGGGDPDRLRAARALLETIAKAPEAVQRDLLLREASGLTGVPEEALRSDLRRRLGGFTARAAAGAPAEADASKEAAGPRPAEELALLELALAHPETHELIATHLPAAHFQDPACRRLYELWQDHGASADWNPMAELAGDDELVKLVAELHATPRAGAFGEAPGALDRAVKDVILRLWKRVLEGRRRELSRRMASATGDELNRMEDEVLLTGNHLKMLDRGWTQALPILELEL